MLRVKKNDTNIHNVFQKCICGAAVPQIRKLLPQIEGLLPRIGSFFLKKRKASFENQEGGGFVHTETQCSFAYGSSVFVSSRAAFVMAKAEQ